MVLGLSFAAVIDFFARSYTTIHCWLSPSAAATRQRAPLPTDKPQLLLLHGFGTSATLQWRELVPALARHFDLIVPDLIFFGGSTTRSPERSEKFQAEAVAALLKALGIDGGGGRGLAAVVGTSYGGFVAYHLAGMARVEKVVGTSYGGFIHEEPKSPDPRNPKVLKTPTGLEASSCVFVKAELDLVSSIKVLDVVAGRGR